MASISKYQDKSLSVPTGKDSLFEEVRVGDMFMTPQSSYSPAVRVKDITKDDAKAYRMIVGKLRSSQFKVYNSNS